VLLFLGEQKAKLGDWKILCVSGVLGLANKGFGIAGGGLNVGDETLFAKNGVVATPSALNQLGCNAIHAPPAMPPSSIMPASSARAL